MRLSNDFSEGGLNGSEGLQPNSARLNRRRMVIVFKMVVFIILLFGKMLRRFVIPWME